VLYSSTNQKLEYSAKQNIIIKKKNHPQQKISKQLCKKKKKKTKTKQKEIKIFQLFISNQFQASFLLNKLCVD